MPFAEFQNGNAGLALPTFALQSQEAYASMMDRAQRRRIADEELSMKKQEFAANMATTAIQQDSMRAELAKRKIDFSEAERKANTLATLREQFASSGGAAQLEANTKVIREMKDPLQMRRAAASLRIAYSKFATDPETHKVIEEQLGALEPVIAETEKSKIGEKIDSGLWAVSRDEAKAMFPGQLIRPMVDPSSGNVLFVADEKPDPMMERRALSKLRVAAASGDVVKIESVLKDPEFSVMMGAAGSRVSDEYFKTMQTAAEVSRKREKDKRDLEDQKMQQQKFDDEQRALTVPGFTGKARSGIVAKELADETAATETSLGLIYKLEDIANKIGNDPTKIADPGLIGEAEVIAKLIQSTNRLAIVGPGAVTEAEWQILEKFAQNPTDAKILVPFFRERAKKGYRASSDALFNKMTTRARQQGLDVDPRYWTRQQITSRRVSPDGPSTDSNVISYKGKDYTKLGATPDGMVLVRDETGKTFKIPDERSRKSQPAQGTARP